MASVTAQMRLRPQAPVLLKEAPGLSSTHLPCSPRTLPAKQCQPCPVQASHPPIAPPTPNPSCRSHETQEVTLCRLGLLPSNPAP